MVFLATIAIVPGLLASPALAESGMEWQFFQAKDAGYKSTRLIYGVPETDNVQVSGACVHSSSIGTNFSIVTFGADIGDLENGKDTELRVSGGGFDHALKGKIIRATGEEGLNGVEIDIGNDDPLWRAFAEKDSLDYLVPGYKAASLDLTRGRDKIQQYVKACETFGDATPPGQSAAAGGDAEKEAFDSAKELGTVEAWEAFIANYPSGFRADLARAYIKKLGSAEPAAAPPASNVSTLIAEADASCKDRSNLRSQNSKTPTKLTFINRSGAMRGILWLDFDGLPKDYANLQDREQVTLDTFMTHPWMVTDGPGNCLRIVLPQSAGTVVELGRGGAATIIKTAPVEQGTPAKKPVAKKATGCEEGFRLVKGRCKRITATEKPQGCPAGTKPVPETDNCVPITSNKSACGQGQIRVEGKCMTKNKAVSFCGPGFRPQGGKCVPGFVAPTGPRPSTHGCPPGPVWNAQEGCHEDD
ncbi:MAG: hypothetical protein WBW51_01190 [Methyloceanibacter sp.]